MQPYMDIDGDSGVSAYEIGDGSITVDFGHGGLYLYTNISAGVEHIIEMQRLAQSGEGLNVYISKHARKAYAKKL